MRFSIRYDDALGMRVVMRANAGARVASPRRTTTDVQYVLT
jgi:hypothetical protein